jgi:hypothetical protein
MITHKQLIRPAVSQKVYNIEILDLWRKSDFFK